MTCPGVRKELAHLTAALIVVALSGCAVPGNAPEAEAGAIAASGVPVRGRGNEPFWRIDIAQSLRFVVGDLVVEGPTPPLEQTPGLRRHRGTVGGRTLDVTIADQICRDTMAGMPHPYQINVVVDGTRYSGCGGEPLTLLTGAEWVVELIDGGIVDRSRATLVFDSDGGLSGRASCNGFTATYTLSGEALQIGAAATTRMACADALLEQEQRFLEILQQVQRFDIDESGALVLIDFNDHKITARRD